MFFQSGWYVLVLGCFDSNTKPEQLDPFFLKLHRYVCQDFKRFNAQALAKEVSTEARLLVEGLQGRPGLKGIRGVCGVRPWKLFGLQVPARWGWWLKCIYRWWFQIPFCKITYNTCKPKSTHRRLRLPQRHNASPATEPQPNSTHSSFRVLDFRGWFGVQIIGCTFKHILHSTFGVFKLRIWFRVSCFQCTLEGIQKSTFGVLKLRGCFGVSCF